MNGNLRALLILIILIVVATITYYIVTESKSKSKSTPKPDQVGDKKGLSSNLSKAIKNVGDTARDVSSNIAKQMSIVAQKNREGLCKTFMKHNNAESCEFVDGKFKYTCPKDYTLIKNGTYCIPSNNLMIISKACKVSPIYKSASFDEIAGECNVECNSPLYIEGEGNAFFNKRCLPNESNLIKGFDCQFGKVATIDISKVSPGTGISNTYQDADKLVGSVNTVADMNQFYNYANLIFDDGYAHGTGMKIVKLDEVPTEFKDSENTISCTKRK